MSGVSLTLPKDVSFQGGEAKDLAIEKRTSDPSPLLAGGIWLRTDLGSLCWSPDGTTVHRAPAVQDVITGTVSVDPPSIATGESANVDVTVTGLTTSHIVIVSCQEALEAGLVPQGASVPVADTLRIRLYNPSAAAIDGAELTWAYWAWIL